MISSTAIGVPFRELCLVEYVWLRTLASRGELPPGAFSIGILTKAEPAWINRCPEQNIRVVHVQFPFTR